MQQAREEENNSLLQLLSNRQNARQQQSSSSGMPSFNNTNNNNDDPSPSPSGQQNGGHANSTSFPPSSSLPSSSVNNITTAAGMMSNYAAARQSLMNDMNNVRGGGVSSGGLGMDHMNSNMSHTPFDMNPISLASMRRGMGGTGTGQGGSLGPSSAFTMTSFMNSRLGCDQAMMNGFGGGDSSGDNDNMDNNRGQNNSNINSMNYNDMISGGNGMSGVGSSNGQQQQQHQQQQQQPSLYDYINNSSLNSDNLPNFETHMNHPFGASGYGGGGLSSSNSLNNNNNINNTSISALSTFLLIGPINAVSTSPSPLNNARWGIESTPNNCINGPFLDISSAFIDTKFTLSPYSSSMDCSVGAATLQLEHHGAQKSITVGLPLFPMAVNGALLLSIVVSICIAVIGCVN